jgi:release factor glutamine methyltransferase
LKQTFKYLTTRLYKPLLVKYLSATRTYTYKGIRLMIPPAVFHPGFFFSTRLLLRSVAMLPLKNKRLLEPGAGSGLIALFAARQGAIVTATDINPVAVQFLETNRRQNRLPLTIITSDLFTHIPRQVFDIIAINPPYYKKQPRTAAEYAWYCGEHGEYFQHLFGGLHHYIHHRSEVLMVLCDGCDIDMIRNIAGQHGFCLTCIQTKKNWIEVNYIFKIENTEVGSRRSEV